MKRVVLALFFLALSCSGNGLSKKPIDSGRLEYIGTWTVTLKNKRVIVDVFDDLDTSHSVDLLHYYQPNIEHTRISVQRVIFDGKQAKMICKYYNGNPTRTISIDYETLLNDLFRMPQ